MKDFLALQVLLSRHRVLLSKSMEWVNKRMKNTKKLIVILLFLIFGIVGLNGTNHTANATMIHHNFTYYFKPHRVRVTKRILARKVKVHKYMYNAKLTKKRWLHVGQKVTVTAPGTNYAWFLSGKGWGKYGTWVIPSHEKDDWFKIIK